MHQVIHANLRPTEFRLGTQKFSEQVIDEVPKELISTGTVLVQGSLQPVFRGHTQVSLNCSACGFELVVGYEPRKLIDLGIKCFKCKAITKTDQWPSDEALPHTLVSCGADGFYELAGPADLSKDVAFISDQEIQRIENLTGVRVTVPSNTSLDFSLDGLAALEVEINSLCGNALSKALGDTRRALKKGGENFIKYPPAWAIIHLQRQIANNSFGVNGVDGIAWAYISSLKLAASRWRHHPLFPSVAKGLVYEFHHSLTLLLIASYLSDHGNQIGFTDASSAMGRSPDLYVNVSPTERLSIEVKTPDELHWPSAVPTSARIEKIIERQARSARDQLTGEAGGVLVLGAFHPTPAFNEVFDMAIKVVTRERQISKRIAAIVGVSISPIGMDRFLPDKLRCSAQFKVSVELNPRFNGSNPIFFE
jgi:hypothetical protein